MKGGPYIKTKRARKMSGRSVKTGGTVIIKKKGMKPLGFKKGALHTQLGVPAGKPIPASKKRAALAGKYGKLAKKRAVFAFRGALKAGRATVSARRRRTKK